MPRKNYKCKRTKKSHVKRLFWKNKRCENQEPVLIDNNHVVQLEDSEAIFNRLMEEGPSTRRKEVIDQR